jgi:DNA polymerase I
VDAVSAEQRRSAKAINFGLIYGMSAFGLARQLGIDRAAAQDYMDRYFARYPGSGATWTARASRRANRAMSRRCSAAACTCPEIKSSNGQRRQYAERTAINAPMQGTAADIIKRAMLAVDDWLAGQSDIHLIMQVHDELVFELPQDRVAEASERIIALMAGAAALRVPLVVEAGSGKNWDEAH